MYPNMWDLPNTVHLENSINENTIAIYVLAGGRNVFTSYMSIEEIIKVADQFDIPVFVDAAAQIPPIETLWKYNQMGATVTLVSGGKDLCGPQATGLVTGKKDFIDIMVNQGFPGYGIGRIFKIGRESMGALYAALKQYLAIDFEAYNQGMESVVDTLKETFKNSNVFQVQRDFPNESGQPVPRAFLEIITEKTTPQEVLAKLKSYKKPIITMTEGRHGVFINPMTLREGEFEIVLAALNEIEKEMNGRMEE